MMIVDNVPANTVRCAGGGFCNHVAAGALGVPSPTLGDVPLLNDLPGVIIGVALCESCLDIVSMLRGEANEWLTDVTLLALAPLLQAMHLNLLEPHCLVSIFRSADGAVGVAVIPREAITHVRNIRRGQA